ncbi:4'-phosphopantetheinyl transferase family protein [Nocardioides zeae]
MTDGVHAVVATTAAVLDAAGGVAAARALLAPYERARADRLHRSTDRDDHVAAHVLVRRVAAALLADGGREVEARDLVLEQRCSGCGGDDHGRPAIAGVPGVHVSLSHARGWVAAGAARGPCGIDVEPVAPVAPLQGVLSPGEAAGIADLGPDARDAAFLRLWTRKEAVVKTGAASLDDLARLDVRGDEPLPGVRVRDLDAPPEVVAAVATVG